MAAEGAMGHCPCGMVQFQLHHLPRAGLRCHCGMCVEVHGSAPLWLPAMKSRFEWLSPARALTWWQSSLTVRRGFCAHCGEPVAWNKVWWPQIFVPARLVEGIALKSVQEKDIYVGGAGVALRVPDFTKSWVEARKRLPTGRQA